MKRAPISDEARVVLRVLEAREREKGKPLTREQRRQLRDEAAWSLERDVRAMCERGTFAPDAPAPRPGRRVSRPDVAEVAAAVEARCNGGFLPAEVDTDGLYTVAIEEVLRGLG